MFVESIELGLGTQNKIAVLDFVQGLPENLNLGSLKQRNLILNFILYSSLKYVSSNKGTSDEFIRLFISVTVLSL